MHLNLQTALWPWLNVLGDGFIRFGDDDVVITGKRPFVNPLLIAVNQPKAFMYLDSSYGTLRIGTQNLSYQNMTFELPLAGGGGTYTDIMALGPLGDGTLFLIPATQVDNNVHLGLDLGLHSYNRRWLSLHVGTGTSSFMGTVQRRTVSSTGTNRAAYEFSFGAADNTDATRKYRFILNVYDTAAREALRCEADGARAWAGVPAGNSTAFAKLGGTIFDHSANAGNGTTVETDLYSDTLPASILATNGDKIEAEYGGVFVSSATATRQIKIYFAGTAIFDTGALTLSLSSAWCVRATIIRVSSTVVRYMISLTTEGAALSAYTAVGELTGLTLSNTSVLKITGQAAGVGAATDDIVAKMGSVKWTPAA